MAKNDFCFTNLAGKITLRSSGTDIVYGCHLLRIIYIISCELLNRLLSNYIIRYICTICTRLDICLMSISRFSLQDKVTLPLFKVHFHGADVVEWSRALDMRLSDCCCFLFVSVLFFQPNLYSNSQEIMYIIRSK
jgi:hypothetical protein